MPLDLPLDCAKCGKDVTAGVRNVDWANYGGWMVGCAPCLLAAGWSTKTATHLVAPDA